MLPAAKNLSQLSKFLKPGTDIQPTLNVLRRLAVALSVSADLLLFDKDERGPDDDLRLQFEAISRLGADEKRVIKEVVESMLIKHESRRWLKQEEKAS